MTPYALVFLAVTVPAFLTGIWCELEKIAKALEGRDENDD